MPASVIFRFARESRRFIVSSGTRNARAISSVLQPAERAQGQRDLRLERERRMAAGEDQLQPLVGKDRLLHLVLHGLGHLQEPRLLGERAVAAQAVDRAIAGRDRQPRARIRRRAVARPALGSDRERLLSGLLGEVEVAEEADQVREDAAPLVAEDLLEQRATSPPAAAPRSRRPSAPPGSARRPRAPRRGRPPRPGGSRPGAPSRR